MKRKAFLMFFCLTFAVSGHAQDSSKHVIGETVEQFAAKVGIDLSACHKLKSKTWSCKSLMLAEQGFRLEVEKEGKWSAVLEGGKLVSFDGNLKK